jgi:glycosyltransferase involved in cell wall biosynthesis
VSSAGEGAPVPASEPKSTAVVLHEPDVGGATKSVLDVLPILERRGWRFSFWVPGRGSTERELRARGYEVASSERLLRFSRRSLLESPGPVRRLAGVPAYLRSFRAWLSSQDAAVAHVNTLLALPELTARPRSGPPTVLHVHEVLPNGLKGTVAGRLARRADVVVAVSGAVADALRPLGIEAIVVHPGVRVPPAAREHAGAERLVVGTIGTVCSRKGTDLFVDAAARVRTTRNSIDFRIVGDLVVGGERSWAERVLESAVGQGIEHRTGVEPYSEMADWDIFVLPSRMDPCPLAVLEAMAIGLPVVGSRVGGIPEEVGDDSGLLVEPEDVEAISGAVLRLAGSPELRRSLGAAARRRVERIFTLERQADGLEGAYRRALECNPQAR